MDVSVVILLVAGLLSGTGLVCFLIAADRQRFLVRFELPQWRQAYYLRALPNFLQALHDHHFVEPWPTKKNAMSASYFRFRARRLLKKRPLTLRKAFLNQHITLYALLENLRPFIRDFVLNQQIRLVGERIVSMEDTIDRDRLIAYLEEARAERARFFATLTDMDRGILAQIIDRKFMPTLKTVHAIFQEHGYTLLPELTQLRRWAEMDGVELVQELPPLPGAKSAQRRARRAREAA